MIASSQFQLRPDRNLVARYITVGYFSRKLREPYFTMSTGFEPTSFPDSGQAEPAWGIARLYSPQGHWTEGEYLAFTESRNQLIELVDGRIEVLEMPTKSHQKIVNYLLNLLLAYLHTDTRGDAIAAPYRVRIRGESFREPDIAVYLTEHADHFGERYGEPADLVVEVVRDDAESSTRDYEDKRRDYALAGIREYWIVDPATSTGTVLTLAGSEYKGHGEFGADAIATSALLNEFSAAVNEVFESAR